MRDVRLDTAPLISEENLQNARVPIAPFIGDEYEAQAITWGLLLRFLQKQGIITVQYRNSGTTNDPWETTYHEDDNRWRFKIGNDGPYSAELPLGSDATVDINTFLDLIAGVRVDGNFIVYDEANSTIKWTSVVPISAAQIISLLNGTRANESLIVFDGPNFSLKWLSQLAASRISVPGSQFDGHLVPSTDSPTNNLLQALQKLDNIRDLEKVHITSVSSETTLDAIDVTQTVAFAHINGNFSVTENGSTVEYLIGQVWLWDTEEGINGEWTLFLEDVRDHIRGNWAIDQVYAAGDFAVYDGLWYFTISNIDPDIHIIYEPDNHASTWRPVNYRPLGSEDIRTGTAEDPRTISALSFNTGVRDLLPSMSYAEAEAGTGLDRRAVQAIVLQRAVRTHSSYVVRATAAEVTHTTDAVEIDPNRGISSYQHGQIISFLTKRANDGAMTLDLSGQGAKTLVNNAGVALTAGQVASGILVTVSYNADSDRFEMMS